MNSEITCSSFDGDTPSLSDALNLIKKRLLCATGRVGEILNGNPLAGMPEGVTKSGKSLDK